MTRPLPTVPSSTILGPRHRARRALRIVFLDIDGVLNSRPFLMTRPAAASHREAALNAFDPRAIRRLERIVKEADAKVVISSAWRHAYPSVLIGEFLAHHGFTGTVIDSTPSIPRRGGDERGYEIREWLLRQPAVTAFVILDDIRTMGPLQHALVNTSSETGLLDSHVVLALKILRSDSLRYP